MSKTELRVISWNILNDIFSNIHPPQKDRLNGITKTINRFLIKSPTIITLVEVGDPKNVKLIAKKIGFKYFDSIKYSDDWMSYISNVPITDFRSIQQNASRLKYPKDKTAQLTYRGTTINILHMPQYIVKDQVTRLSFMSRVIKNTKYNKSIIVGDFNALALQPSRLYLWLKGYRLAWATSKMKDKFPSYFYKGKNIPSWVPNLSIDAHYSSKDIAARHHYRLNTDYSDHPILVSDFIEQG